MNGWRVAFGVALAASLVVLLSPGSSLPPTGEATVPHVDKVEHVLLFATLAFLAARAFGASPWVVLALLSLYGAVTEVAQHWVPQRSADILDWVADTSGALMAFARTRRRPSPRP